MVLSWTEPRSFSECFSAFTNRVVGGPYWRPVTWTIDTMTKYFYSYNPIPYHVTNIIVYSAICLLFYLFLRKLGFEFIRAWLGAFIFAVLPAHELSVSWVAGRTDTIMALFLLSSILLFQRKSGNILLYICTAIIFLFSVLSKEPAFAGVLLPMILYSLFKDKYPLKKSIIATSIALAIVLLALVYRYFVIGGSPFESSNFSGITVTGIVLNFFAYWIVSFIRADTMALIYYYIKTNPVYLIGGIILFIALLILIITRFRKSDINDKKKFAFGILWFIIFIVPATARFGQWYAFTASMGLVISIISLLQFDIEKFRSKIIISAIVIAGTLSCLYMFDRNRLWHNAANISHSAFGSIEYKAKERDTLILLGVPDKVDMINCAKIGCEQAVWNKYNSKRIEVSSPLRIEMKSNAQIDFRKLSDSVIIINIKNGRFLRVGSLSRAVIIPETMEYEDGFQSFKIETRIKPEVQSQAIVTIKERTLRNRVFVFTGNKFMHLE